MESSHLCGVRVPHVAGNIVGALQEKCFKLKYPLPTYDPGAAGGEPHKRHSGPF